MVWWSTERHSVTEAIRPYGAIHEQTPTEGSTGSWDFNPMNPIKDPPPEAFDTRRLHIFVLYAASNWRPSIGVCGGGAPHRSTKLKTALLLLLICPGISEITPNLERSHLTGFLFLL